MRKGGSRDRFGESANLTRARARVISRKRENARLGPRRVARDQRRVIDYLAGRLLEKLDAVVRLVTPLDEDHALRDGRARAADAADLARAEPTRVAYWVARSGVTILTRRVVPKASEFEP